VAGRWEEVLNTDAAVYSGSGVGNLGVIETEDVGWHGHPVSASLQLPPLGTLWLRPVPEPAAGSSRVGKARRTRKR